MSFWSSEKIKDQQRVFPSLITPFNPQAVQQGAYELALGPQGAVSCDGNGQITDLKPRQQLCIPPGQFGLLLTEEIISIPHDVVAFISLKMSVKSLGLVNVSGFHVDPGFNGRLKFWIYNAGNNDIPVLRGDRLFMIWFSEFDRITSDYYKRNSSEQNEITSKDILHLKGQLASPAELSRRINDLKTKCQRLDFVTNTLTAVVIGLCLVLAAPLVEGFIKPLIEVFYTAKPAVSTAPQQALPGAAPVLIPKTTAPTSSKAP